MRDRNFIGSDKKQELNRFDNLGGALNKKLNLINKNENEDYSQSSSKFLFVIHKKIKNLFYINFNFIYRK